METNKLRKDFDYLIQSTEKLPLLEQTLKRYKHIYEEIFLYCIERHLSLFTHQNAADYCNEKCPALKAYAVKQTRKIAYTVARYFEGSGFIWEATAVSQYPVCRDYEQLLEKFRQELLGKLSPGTVRVETGIVQQFLYFLEQSGTTDTAYITTEDVLDFVRQESSNHKSSLAQFLRSMRKFVCFLRSECIVDLNADRFLKNAGRSRQKVLPCFTEDELQRIFHQIDRTTDTGRRDYAVFLLSLRTGLRASDIAKLKLTILTGQRRQLRSFRRKRRLL